MKKLCIPICNCSLGKKLTGTGCRVCNPYYFEEMAAKTQNTMTDKPTTPLPTVHLGGTSHKMLDEGYKDAYFALKTFTKAFGHIEFNARDYYMQGTQAWNAAVDARIEMNEKIRDLVKYLEDHLESLAEQAPKK